MTTQPDGKNAQRPEDAQPEMPLIEHLLELRNRLLKMVLAVIICFAAIYPFANELYLLISQPLRDLLPVGQTMIATDITSPFFAPLKLALVLAVFVAIPVILYQLWGRPLPITWCSRWCSDSSPPSARKALLSCRISAATSISY